MPSNTNFYQNTVTISNATVSGAFGVSSKLFAFMLGTISGTATPTVTLQIRPSDEGTVNNWINTSVQGTLSGTASVIDASETAKLAPFVRQGQNFRFTSAASVTTSIYLVDAIQ